MTQCVNVRSIMLLFAYGKLFFSFIKLKLKLKDKLRAMFVYLVGLSNNLFRGPLDGHKLRLPGRCQRVVIPNWRQSLTSSKNSKE